MMPDITPQELQERIAKGEKVTLFDVREEWEYNESNIGATSLPLPTIPMKIDALASLKSKEIIVHCQSGKRSNQAKKFLSKHGFDQVRSLIGGVDAYKKANEN